MSEWRRVLSESGSGLRIFLAGLITMVLAVCGLALIWVRRRS